MAKVTHEQDAKELLTNPAAVAPMLLQAPWLRVALRSLGVSDDNLTDGKIRSYLQGVSCQLYTPDQKGRFQITDWCSAFVNDCMRRVYICGTNRPNARSWMQWATGVSIPRLGDVAVFWRVKENDTKTYGHVGFFVKYCGRNVVVLGGNQTGGRVSFAEFPINGPRIDGGIGLLGFRRYEMASAGSSA